MKLKTALIGAGKMGISHLAILGAHPDLELVAVCDSSGYVLTGLRKHTGLRTYKSLSKLLDREQLDILVVATPTSTHFEATTEALRRGLAVFVEKPLSLDLAQSRSLCDLAAQSGRTCQVGYHNRFLYTFREAKRLVECGALGQVYSITGTAFGPVVLRPPSGSSWRSKKSEGGGCLHDYASHVIDLMNFLVGTPSRVTYAATRSVFSTAVEDVVKAAFTYESGADGRLEANWSDPTSRKMSTTITLWGTNGKIVVDRQECLTYLVKPSEPAGYPAGYTVRYITDLQPCVDFYLRGEEYSAQIDSFVKAVAAGVTDNLNSFASAYQTDKVIHDIATAAAENN